MTTDAPTLSTVESTKGILGPGALDKKFHLSRHVPSNEISFFIEHYWIVKWDLRGEKPYEAETLPYPSVNVVVEKGKSGIWGVITGRFTRRLEEKGEAFAIKFRPGGFHSFISGSVSDLTDKVLSLEELFGNDGREYEHEILTTDNDNERITSTEKFIRSRNPSRDESIILVNQIIDTITSNREIRRVDDVVSLYHINKRSLQRLFNEYVGVGPKWVVKRYRLQEAADQLAGGEDADLPQLALDLGYFDQPHFIKDFKSIVGKTPTEYSRKAATEDNESL
jgi:AraC-like DNA-binding protein